ncbi:unnamed protein product [Nezara viridula]|uniref:Uncharacterized protein n=1 Tax=Nezara viridula TaxID=85310 RepID=A0A9P0E392_NEZVI|nr:unnamed protein product [Nezara viridula]
MSFETKERTRNLNIASDFCSFTLKVDFVNENQDGS